MTGLDAKLAEVARQYDDLSAQLARPRRPRDPDALRRLGRELARLEPVVAAYRAARARPARELAGARELRDAEADDELRAMAREEIDRARGATRRGCVDGPARCSLLPRDPNDDRNVIVEIRAGAGGEEAALFASELLRMYAALRGPRTASSPR